MQEHRFHTACKLGSSGNILTLSRPHNYEDINLYVDGSFLIESQINQISTNKRDACSVYTTLPQKVEE